MTEPLPPAPKGHWRKGKRRNPDAGEWGHTLVALATLFRLHSEPGKISANALGRDVGVYAKTVMRWLRGECRPPEDVQEMVATWVAQKQAIIQERRKRTSR